MSGDYKLEDSVYILFTTRAFATGIPGVLSASTVAVYEDVTATPIQTAIAVTETLNAINGLNAVTITAAAASGYNAGGHYHVVIEAGTVDSVSVVGEVVGSFSIAASAAAQDLANATDGLGAIKAETALILADTGTDGVVIAAAQTVATVTTLTNLPTIPANWLTAAGIAATAMNGKGDWNVGKTGYSLTTADWNVGKTGYSLTATTGLGAQTANITGNLSGSVGSVTGAVGSVTGAVGSVTGAVGSVAGNVDGNVTGTVASVVGAVGSVTGHTAQTGDSFAIVNGAAGLVAIDTVVDAVKVVVDNLDLGIIYGTAATGTLSTTVMTSDLTGYLDDELIGRVVVWTGGTADGQASDITDYASASGTVTYTAITTAPANADTFKIV